MRRRPAAWLLLSSSSIVAVLAGCERRESPRVQPLASSASHVVVKAPPDADDDAMPALMRLAFPGWKPDDRQVLHVPRRDDPQATTTIRIEPRMVVKIDAAHRALVTVGEWSDEHGNDSGAHSEQGTVGVYVFERHAQRWVKTHAQDAVAWAGSDGELSDVRALELGPGHPALLVEGSYTGQGETTVWTHLVEIEPGGSRVVLPDLEVHEDTFGASGGCEDWVSGAVTPSSEQLSDPNNPACHEITGKWRIQPLPGAERGDFVVDYTRHHDVDDEQTHAKRFQTDTATVVYRYGASGYVKVSGEKPY